MRYTPRDHQQVDVGLIAKALEHPGVTSRAQYLAACGTGKTLTSLWVVERLDASRIIVGLPSLGLIDQSLQVWKAAAAQPLEMMALCSAPDLMEMEGGALTSVRTSTSPDDIAPYWDAPVPQGTRRVLWVCYASTEALSALLNRLGAPIADVLICDEAHLLAGAQKVAQGWLDDAVIPGHRRLLQTATPIETPAAFESEVSRDDTSHEEADGIAGEPLSAETLHEEQTDTPAVSARRVGSIPATGVGMERTDLFGPVVAERTFGWAIANEILTEYVIASPAPITPVVREILSRLDVPAGMPDDFWTRAYVVMQSATSGTGKRLLSFHRTVKSAKAYGSAFQSLARLLGTQPLMTSCLTGEDSVQWRRTELRRLADSPSGIITTARALAVGIDVPGLDGVALVEPRKSVVEVAQILGRAVRRDPARPEKVAHILIPIVDATQADGTLVRGGDWDTLAEVVEALSEHDSRLRGELRAVQAASERTTAGEEHPTASEALAAIGARFQLNHLTGSEAEALRSALVFRLASRYAKRRADYWAALDAYAAQHGTILFPQQTRYQGLALGAFLRSLRHGARAGTLIQVELSRVEVMPGWTVDPARTQWILDATGVKAWMDAHGGKHPSYPADNAEESVVGVWVKNVRAEANPATKRGVLALWQREWLESHIPTWSWKERDAQVQRRVAPPTQSQTQSAPEGMARRRVGSHLDVPTRHARQAVHVLPPMEWWEQCASVARHVAQTGTLPRMSGVPTPSVPERLLSLWWEEALADSAADTTPHAIREAMSAAQRGEETATPPGVFTQVPATRPARSAGSVRLGAPSFVR